MKKLLLCLLFFIGTLSHAQIQNGTWTFSPSNFDVNDEVTITLSGVDPTVWNSGEPNNIYLWTWYFDGCNNQVGGPLIGNGEWNDSNDALQFTNNGNGTYSFTMTPATFYGTTNISRIGVLAKAHDGTGDKKTPDELEYVGNGITIQLELPSSTPAVLNSGDDLTVRGIIYSQGNPQFGVTYELFYNEVSQVTASNGFPNFQSDLTNLTTSGTVRVEATVSGEVASCSFDVIIAPSVVNEAMPAGLVDGINYDDLDDTKATLVLNAPLKDFVYVAGSFNNYNPGNGDLMKKDTASGKFFLEINGLTPGQIETYQYWVYALNPVANSPALVKTADPFSTLVLSPFDDPFIPASTYPNLPSYPAGQEREVTILQTGQTAYNWQVPNFSKPKKEDLIIYEVLIRDFDADRNFQDLIDKVDYFKNLNINAIELMPVMEFEGNESWGYNTAFHMALDKFYGTETKFKELIDTYHQNGIAVILDLALNHAFGRSPMVRMWMDDPDNNGWGEPSSENPYMNEVALHSYSVGSDFDHSNPLTQMYTQRVIKHWIENFKIDGFRWDLTKGFTQNCSANDEPCTNGYQQDRIDVLKSYADYSWSLDDTHYVIFEHLGSDAEEQEWANYRLGDTNPKGIMMWSEMWNDYKELGKGNNGNISRMGHEAHGFTEKRTLGYPESHDKDRIMYEMVQFGDNDAGFDLNTSLKRMSSIGAISIPIPGPKMVWHFADLGMDDSIWLCSDGITVNSDYDGNNDGDCKLDTKPQPQWSENWLADANRNQVYSDWARLNFLKANEDVFEGDYTINSNNVTPRIYIRDNSLPAMELKDVIIVANFSTSTQNINPIFPYTGTWYDLMDESGSTTINVTNVNSPLSIPTGEFRIYGNAIPETLSTDATDLTVLKIYPNPTRNQFTVNKHISNLKVYNITGKMVKEFKGDFSNGHVFDISDLSQSLYFIKIKNNLGREQSAKLIKL